MPVMSVDIDFEVFCSCGNGLCHQVEVIERRNAQYELIIKPCEDCLERVKTDSYNSYNDGYYDGLKESKN